MEFYIGSRLSDDNIEGETVGKFTSIIYNNTSYLIPIIYTPSRKQSAMYINGYLRTPPTISDDPNIITTYVLIQYNSTICIAKTHTLKLEHFNSLSNT